MTSSPPSAVGPLVTVQSAGTSAAHGLLVSDAVVFVPHPPRDLFTAPTLNAVIEAGPGGGAPPESIGVSGTRLLCLDDGTVRATLAVLTLAGPSGLRQKVPLYSAARLGEAVADHAGDLWSALGSLGYRVPPGAGRNGDGEVRPDLPAFASTPADGQAVERYGSIAAFAANGCLMCGCCLPPNPPPE